MDPNNKTEDRTVSSVWEYEDGSVLSVSFTDGTAICLPISAKGKVSEGDVLSVETYVRGAIFVGTVKKGDTVLKKRNQNL